jgi:L-amino acid N-acyltransferase YncA
MQTSPSAATAALRLSTPDDAAAILEIYAPNITDSAISFEYEVPSTEEMRSRIATTLTSTPWLVCEQSGAIVGYAYASKHHGRAAYQWSADASIYVSAAARRLGVGRALYTALFALTRLQGFRAIHAGITVPNAASVAFHEAFGFKPVGVYPKVGYKRGAWRSVGWWQLELASRDGAPERVTPWPTLLAVEAERVAHVLARGVCPGLPP